MIIGIQSLRSRQGLDKVSTESAQNQDDKKIAKRAIW